jgi:hypothetical protein
MDGFIQTINPSDEDMMNLRLTPDVVKREEAV